MRKRRRSQLNSGNASPVQLARSASENVRLRLIAASAGRCEFRGCNKDLHTHSVTGTHGNFSEAAHIVAFRPDGPRGDGIRPNNINSFENLMLLCKDCHHLIDTNPDGYPVSMLREFKAEHEERIRALTAIGPEYRTTVIQVRGAIGGQAVDIAVDDIRDALSPRYPARLPGLLIDLTSIQREDPAFFDLARDQIRRELRPVLRTEFETKRVQHYSVFGLAPIPLLTCLGRELGDKVSVDVFQRHREPPFWKWRDDGVPVEYAFGLRSPGTDQGSVGLILSLSGSVTDGSLPPGMIGTSWLYEITLKDHDPRRDFLRMRADLVRFRRAYREALATIIRKHDGVKEIHVFPAVPAAIAIACGQELLPKAHPDLLIYDNVKGTFSPAIIVNGREELWAMS